MESKCLICPCAKEGGSWVLFEAMMCSKPIVCFDTSGMSVIVTNETGIKIPIKNYDESVINFANAIRTIITDDSIAKEKGEMGYKRVLSEFEWESKAEFIEKLFNKL